MSKWLKIGIAVLVALIFFSLGRGEQQTEVVALAADAPAGHVLSPDDLTVVSLPASLVPADAVTDPQAAVGQQLAVPRNAGDVLRQSNLGVASMDLRPNERGVAVRVSDPDGVAGLLKPGDHVGLVALIRGDAVADTMWSQVFAASETQAPDMATTGQQVNPGDYAKVLFEPLRVLWVSPEFQPTEVKGDMEQQQMEQSGLFVSGMEKAAEGTLVLAVPTGPVDLTYDFTPLGFDQRVTMTVNPVELLAALKLSDGVRFTFYLAPDQAQGFTTPGLFVQSLLVLPQPTETPTPTPTPAP